MTLYAYINANSNRVRLEIRMGLIPCTIMRQWEIYSRYDIFRRAGMNVTQAVCNTSCEMRVGERYVYLTIKKMENNYEGIADQP